MYDSLTHYYNELLLERTFKKLVNYTDHRTLLATLKVRADRNFKHNYLNRWINALQDEEDDNGNFEVADNFYSQSLLRRSL